MKRLNQEQIEEIRKLRKEGKTIRFLCKKYNVCFQTIQYHISEEFRMKLRIYNNKRYNEMSKEQKKKLFKERREYQRKYHYKKYNEDEEFRKIQLERSNKVNRINLNKLKEVKK
ncbi:MAG TPA: hypothetical protein ENI61_06245 [Ignavibacteria bacterium]|nr:hypothetical protein [Ignavibacteria bacterium]